jgi:GTPase Era involved in 16S rRNA processing
LLEALFRESYRRIERETQILRDKLELPCNDTDKEALRTVYKLLQAELAEVSASIRESEIREMEERAAVREMEERAAVRENLCENQQHEWPLNLSKEINQISDAKRAVLENLTATSSLHADLQTRENLAAQNEAYRKQGMATSL